VSSGDPYLVFAIFCDQNPNLRETNIMKLMVFNKGFETYDIWKKFSNLWYFPEVLKPMLFCGGPKTHGILQRFWNPWYFMEFCNLWYFTEILKPMVFYGGLKTHGILCGFKKTPRNMFRRDGLAEETTNLSKWLNGGFNP